MTNACFDPSLLVKNYPRGERELRQAFSRFTTSDTVQWFENRGVQLKTEPDGRMFPVTDSSATIVNCLLDEAGRLGVRVLINKPVETIDKADQMFRITFRDGQTEHVDKLLVAVGGSPKAISYDWLSRLGLKIEPPVPSLFTFNLSDAAIRTLMGVSVDPVLVSIEGTKLKSHGPLLITHWGFSGPAILKLSAWAARELSDRNYQFTLRVDWLPGASPESTRSLFQEMRKTKPSGKIRNSMPDSLPRRLWEFILEKTAVPEERVWAEFRKDEADAVIRFLHQSEFIVSGKTTFKEEFVTCGGVSLKEIDFKTMASRKLPGLHFAGEVLDIDGVTGGFNFQSAWTTGYIAGLSMAGG